MCSIEKPEFQSDKEYEETWGRKESPDILLAEEEEMKLYLSQFDSPKFPKEEGTDDIGEFRNKFAQDAPKFKDRITRPSLQFNDVKQIVPGGDGAAELKIQINFVFDRFERIFQDATNLNRQNRSKKFDTIVFELISEICALHIELIQKLPDDKRKEHEKYDLNDILPKLYVPLKFHQLGVYVSLLEFTRNLLIECVAALEQNQELSEFFGQINTNFFKNSVASLEKLSNIHNTLRSKVK